MKNDSSNDAQANTKTQSPQSNEPQVSGRRGLRRIFNVRLWSDSDRVKGFFHYILSVVSKLFIIRPQKPGVTFDEAVAQYALTEVNLKRYRHALLTSSLVCLGLSVFIFFYALYHAAAGTLNSFIITLALMLIGLCLAFRYHFWYMQLTKRRLGCSFVEWVQFTFKRSLQ